MRLMLWEMILRGGCGHIMKEMGGEEDEDNCLVDVPHLCTDASVRYGNIHIYVVLFRRNRCNNIGMQVSRILNYVPWLSFFLLLSFHILFSSHVCSVALIIVLFISDLMAQRAKRTSIYETGLVDILNEYRASHYHGKNGWCVQRME